MYYTRAGLVLVLYSKYKVYMYSPIFIFNIPLYFNNLSDYYTSPYIHKIHISKTDMHIN